LTELELAIAKNAECAALQTDIAVAYLNRNEYTHAERHCELAVDIDATSVAAYHVLSETLIATHRRANAISVMAHASALAPDYPRSILMTGWVYALGGSTARASESLKSLEMLSRSRYVPPFEVARIYLGVRDFDSAFSWLELALLERCRCSLGLNVSECLMSYGTTRASPYFRSVLASSGPEPRGNRLASLNTPTRLRLSPILRQP
jgi:tetratricopeptide (TPR) repeat protein